MRIISEKKLRDFWQENPQAEKAMREWIKVVQKAEWRNFSDLKQSFNHADVYGSCTIFDVGGNKYRVIGKVAYGIQVVFIRSVLTHLEYDREKWKPDC